ncbi:MAG: cytochrome c biogenesis protein CcsA [Flavobacteriales bacterium]|nr:cytochrome c biogenesis protein CcsA [Flavobacteriales bacterium]
MEYVGEHLLPGKLGHFFVILSFCTSLLAAVGYYLAVAKKNSDWKFLARYSFYLHSLAVIGIVSTLFYMLANQMYEYHYVWKHSNNEMPMRYIFSCFWEGQEGSFLLWSFWHVVLGLIFIWREKEWEAPVMATFSSVQVFLSSMLLGIYILEHKIGSNPFTILVREDPEFAHLPLFTMPDYLENLDGRGLNPLLQNYWMTIHPPTLFLGFASTLIPFAFAIAGLWTKKFNEWIKPALPWTFFSIMILGTGILMGGAWAYEALSFGGFWAWDPVENASLVPWLTLVGAGHLMLLQKNRGNVGLAMFGLVLISFVLILYSTFLTRSGVLGETSVHAFTDLGMSGQLLLYLVFYLALSIVLVAVNFKSLRSTQVEEPFWSREFWMFTGALVLFISAFQITFSTSIPVINKIFSLNLAPPTNAIEHYNSWQIPFGIVVLIIIGFGQHLRYKNNNFKQFLNGVFTALIASLVLSIAIGLALKIKQPFHLFFMFASLFAVIGNIAYFIKILKGKVAKAGSTIAHIGFGLMMLGALISMSSQENISTNTSKFDVAQLGEAFSNAENILLMKGDTLQMGDYHVSYLGKEREGVNIYFIIDYFLKNDDGTYQHAFQLKPRVQTNPRMGNVAEPDTRHFLSKDIYTHVTWAILEEEKDDPNEYDEPEIQNLKSGDTVYLKQGIFVLDSIRRLSVDESELRANDIVVGAKIHFWNFDTEEFILEPLWVLRDTNSTFSIPAENEKANIRVTFDKINPSDGSVDLGISFKKGKQQDFIVMQATQFPFINVLWLGCIVMIIGTIIAIYSRVKLNSKSRAK